MKKTIISAFIALSTLITTVGMSFGDLLVPVMTYRVGPFAANGTMNANGFVDYMTMLNAVSYTHLTLPTKRIV